MAQATKQPYKTENVYELITALRTPKNDQVKHYLNQYENIANAQITYNNNPNQYNFFHEIMVEYNHQCEAFRTVFLKYFLDAGLEVTLNDIFKYLFNTDVKHHQTKTDFEMMQLLLKKRPHLAKDPSLAVYIMYSITSFSPTTMNELITTCLNQGLVSTSCVDCQLQGETARRNVSLLHIAVDQNNPEIVRTLRHYGAVITDEIQTLATQRDPAVLAALTPSSSPTPKKPATPLATPTSAAAPPSAPSSPDSSSTPGLSATPAKEPASSSPSALQITGATVLTAVVIAGAYKAYKGWKARQEKLKKQRKDKEEKTVTKKTKTTSTEPKVA